METKPKPVLNSLGVPIRSNREWRERAEAVAKILSDYVDGEITEDTMVVRFEEWREHNE